MHTTPDKRQIPLDAIFWLDYRSAKLYATTPEVSNSASSKQLFTDIAIRDVIEDFKIAPGIVPHFLMNCASLGAIGGGSSALFVIETTTKQVAVYRAYSKTTGLNAKPEFELVQVKSYGRPDPSTPIEAVSASGAITMQLSMDKSQIPLEGVYWLESSTTGAMFYTAIPELRQVGTTRTIVGEISNRNIGNDFKLKSGVAPRFMLSPVSLGAPAMGMAAPFVIESTSKQIGIYRVAPQSTASGSRPNIELLQVKPYEESLPSLPPGTGTN
jgi:hypothetical protein